MNRRTYMKAIGAAGTAAGLGGLSVLESGGAFAQISRIDANDVTVSNDRGELHKVTIDPTFKLDWSGFDDVVAKIMMVVEGRYGKTSSYTPIFRMTPWLDPGGNSGSGLNSSGPGTSGHFYVNSPLSQIIAGDSRYTTDPYSSPLPRPVPRPLEVVNEAGRPDYESVSDSTYPGGSESGYLGGGNMGSASAAETSLVDGAGLPLVNNFPTVDAGYYGAAEAAADANPASDGSSADTAVVLRYTYGFIRANLSYMKYKYNGGTAFTGSTDAEKIQNAVDAAHAAGDTYWEVSDIDAGNSAFCMTTETSKNYANARTNIGEPIVLSDTGTFTVTLDNVAAASGGSVTSGTGGS